MTIYSQWCGKYNKHLLSTYIKKDSSYIWWYLWWVGGFEDSDILETANFNVVCNY
jgi:hypothetical protein